MSEELKPCPFCGSNEMYTRYLDVKGLWFLSCTSCYVRFSELTRHQVVKKWNTRHSDQYTNDKACMVISPEGYKNEYIRPIRDEFAMAFPHLNDEQLDDEIEPGESPIECQARISYQYADAMMKEREK